MPNQPNSLSNYESILTGKPKGKRSLRSTRRWEDNVRIDLNEICVNKRIVFIRIRIGITGEL